MTKIRPSTLHSLHSTAEPAYPVVAPFHQTVAFESINGEDEVYLMYTFPHEEKPIYEAYGSQRLRVSGSLQFTAHESVRFTRVAARAVWNEMLAAGWRVKA